MKREDDKICVWGARVHNLKNIDVDIPLNKIVGIAGLRHNLRRRAEALRGNILCLCP